MSANNKITLPPAYRAMGRPRGGMLTTSLMNLLKAPASRRQQNITMADALMSKLVKCAGDGDMQAMKLVMEYAEGKPVAQVPLALAVEVVASATPEELAELTGTTPERYRELAERINEDIDIEAREVE